MIQEIYLKQFKLYFVQTVKLIIYGIVNIYLKIVRNEAVAMLMGCHVVAYFLQPLCELNS